MFAGFFRWVEKTMEKTGKNRPGKNRFWTGFFRLGGKNTLADRAISRDPRCRDRALTTKKADLQFKVELYHLIVK